MRHVPTPEEALQRVCDLIGGQVKVAEVCGYPDRRHVWPWFGGGRKVPQDKCPALEKATAGEITCELLRPDVAWGRIKDREWPHPKGRPVVEVSKAVA